MANQANIIKGITLLWDAFQHLGGEMPSGTMGATASRGGTGRGRGPSTRGKTTGGQQNVAATETNAAPQAQTQTRRKYTRRKQVGQAA